MHTPTHDALACSRRRCCLDLHGGARPLLRQACLHPKASPARSPCGHAPNHASSFHCLRTPPRPHSAAAAASTHRRRRSRAVARRAAARRAAARGATARSIDTSRANARCTTARRAAARRAATRRHPMCHCTASRAALHFPRCRSPSCHRPRFYRCHSRPLFRHRHRRHHHRRRRRRRPPARRRRPLAPRASHPAFSDVHRASWRRCARSARRDHAPRCTGCVCLIWAQAHQVRTGGGGRYEREAFRFRVTWVLVCCDCCARVCLSWDVWFYFTCWGNPDLKSQHIC